MTNRVRYRPAPRARIVQHTLARERPRFCSPRLHHSSRRIGWKSGRHKASRDNDTSLNLSDKGPAQEDNAGECPLCLKQNTAGFHARLTPWLGDVNNDNIKTRKL
jgi:hypothetical protein